MGKKKKSLAVLTAICMACPWGNVYGAENGTWELSDNGKHWMYFYSPADPAKDQWIEDQGKEYYVDSQGYMKTGWVTDKRDQNKYYMGQDGAKAFNLFTPDGHYVGPDGVVLQAFDAYRKAVKNQLSTVMRDKEYKAVAALGELPGFVLMDLNGDGYRDAVAVDRHDHPGRVVMAAVWQPQEGAMALSTEADLKGEGSSWLSYNDATQTMWLASDRGNGWDRDYFLMDEGGAGFENKWSFTAKLDGWGDPVYYVGGVVSSQKNWNQCLSMAREDAGTALTLSYQPLDQEHIKQAVDRAPTPGELPLWQP